MMHLYFLAGRASKNAVLSSLITAFVVECSAAMAPDALAGDNRSSAAPAGLTQYTFGAPSGDAVEMLEVINRARSNPTAEGQRIVAALNAAYPNGGSGSDLTQLANQFASFPARPPVAFNGDLNAAAAAHLADNFRLGTQSHDSPDGTPADLRVRQFGYLMLLGENCTGTKGYTVALRPWTVNGTYELNDASHRDIILETSSLGEVEVDIGQMAAGGWNVEDFGGAYTVPLLTGVAFSDDAKTGFFASGEGLSDVLVTSSASSYYALTINGAYTLPLDLVPPYDANNPHPTVTVSFTTSDGDVHTQTVTLNHTVSANGDTYHDSDSRVRYDNAKADLVLSASLHPTFFSGEIPLTEGVNYLVFSNGNIFGYYEYLSNPHFIYHFDLGFEYVFDANDGHSGVYLYDFTSQDFYTSPTFPFPYLYDFNLQTFLYYYPDPAAPGRYNTDGIRYFFRFDTGKIFAK